MNQETNMVESCSAYEEINDFPFALLDKSNHDRESFDCGVEPLNQYIKQYARQHMQNNISKTIVFYNPDGDKKLKPIVGFVTVDLLRKYSSHRINSPAIRFTLNPNRFRLLR